MALRLSILKADHGDCFLVSHREGNKSYNLLIDGGTASTFRRQTGAPGPLKLALDSLKSDGQQIDLAILTHIDSDHIGGLKRGFETKGYLSSITKKFWYNSSKLITDYVGVAEIPENFVYLRDISNPETSFRQAHSLEILLDKIGCWHKDLKMAGQKTQEGPFSLTILSPREEDIIKLAQAWPKELISPLTAGRSRDFSLSFSELLKNDRFVGDQTLPNRSSISFILETGCVKCLFLADAPDDVVVQTLKELGYTASNRLKVDLVKVSHHGSQFNTSPDFLSLIEPTSFLFSTNGRSHNHPDRITIARILHEHPDANLYFNYEETIKLTFSNTELTQHSQKISSIQYLDLCT
ncbi:ComEC/Rec2 family competence protein [Pseudomonas salomonii]|uniref:MBL fold metallo-hydrolase n=1 Tax=Pseudomonas salomonii TaxID=191391 RepID=A0ABS9GNR9_9PSED|nr:MBL fold metallo-hydrolase [Pseudomonas salomonii]MCF5547359.1 MBL fold metallo-hydrolase [Pseudomonas salomonii]